MVIAYDFDGTLAPGNMQERDFIPALNTKTAQFWDSVKKRAKQHDMDEILAYMEIMLEKAKQEEVPVRRKDFMDYGKNIKFFPGVTDWFERVNEIANDEKIMLEHYVISSGLREMIAGTSINKYIRRIFASGFRYDHHGVAVWPALAINYTNKTQFLFRINKGIDNSYDNEKINQFTKENDRPVPFRNMIYIGDGETDVPCMKMIKYQRGNAIAVYHPRKHGAKEKASILVGQERADFVFPADYREQSSLFKAVHDIIIKIAAENRLSRVGKP